jgi:excisionase family DNA binding protein
VSTAAVSSFLTIAEAAEFLRLSEPTVRRLISNRMLRALRASPRRVLIPQTELDRYLADAWIDRIVGEGEKAGSTTQPDPKEIANEA